MMKKSRIFILIILLLSILSISTSTADYTFNTIGYGYLGYNAGSGAEWDILHDATAATAEYATAAMIMLDTEFEQTNKWNWITRSYIIFDTRTLPEGDYCVTLCLYTKNNPLDQIVNDWHVTVSSINCADMSNPGVDDYDQFTSSPTGDMDYNWTDNTWRNESFNDDIFLNPGGYTVVGLRHNSDYLDERPTYVSSKMDCQGWDSATIIVSDAPPEYTADLSSTGTFCLAHQISFNLSETTEQAWGIYSISGYHNGIQPSDWTVMDINTGPYLYSRTLDPGNWSVLGDIQIDDTHYQSWNNFTIDSTCTATTFNGTINGTYSPWEWTNFTWNWTNPYTTPWNWTPPESANNTFIWEMYDHGYINESEWLAYQEWFNWSLEHPEDSPANFSNFNQVITGLDDAAKTSRSNLNTSHTVLQQSLSPISVLFPYALGFFPPQIIDLIGVILAIDLAIIIISRRKE